MSKLPLYVSRASVESRLLLLMLAVTKREEEFSIYDGLKELQQDINETGIEPALLNHKNLKMPIYGALPIIEYVEEIFDKKYGGGSPAFRNLFSYNLVERALIRSWFTFSLSKLLPAIENYIEDRSEKSKLRVVELLDVLEDSCGTKFFGDMDRITMADLCIAMTLTLLDFVPSLYNGRRVLLRWQKRVINPIKETWESINAPFWALRDLKMAKMEQKQSSEI